MYTRIQQYQQYTGKALKGKKSYKNDVTIGQNSREKYVKVAELRLIPLEII